MQSSDIKSSKEILLSFPYRRHFFVLHLLILAKHKLILRVILRLITNPQQSIQVQFLMLMLLLLSRLLLYWLFDLFRNRFNLRDKLIHHLLFSRLIDVCDFLFGDFDFVFLQTTLPLSDWWGVGVCGGGVGVAGVGEDGGLLFHGGWVEDGLAGDVADGNVDGLFGAGCVGVAGVGDGGGGGFVLLFWGVGVGEWGFLGLGWWGVWVGCRFRGGGVVFEGDGS